MHYDFRARNNHCGTIAHKIGTSTTFLLRCMKDSIKPWNSMKMNVWKSSTWRSFFCPGCIHYINMNQGLYLILITYARARPLWKIAISYRTDTSNIRLCFLSKRWLNSIFLQISKLNSLVLLKNNFDMLYDVFNDLHLIQNKLKRC